MFIDTPPALGTIFGFDYGERDNPTGEAKGEEQGELGELRF